MLPDFAIRPPYPHFGGRQVCPGSPLQKVDSSLKLLTAPKKKHGPGLKEEMLVSSLNILKLPLYKVITGSHESSVHPGILLKNPTPIVNDQSHALVAIDWKTLPFTYFS